MNQALYRKYRSKTFGEVIGQEHVTDTLQKAIKSGRISHAYLFTGPRGVGKTTVARILAREVNSFKYEGETAHLDIIEIDAASNRRIDEIRDLRERVRIAPAFGKYKVYIIDEVHMLTKEAFNALLKTLEEPPAHTIFILATTEAHKLPDTIISRTQRFEFKPIPVSSAVKQLGAIAKSEKISIEPEALELLAQFGNGSFRDSISYLDQLGSAGSKIGADDVRRILGLPSENQISSLLLAVSAGASSEVLTQLQLIKDKGVDAATLAASISAKIRNQLVNGGETVDTDLLKELLEVPASSRPYDLLEIVLLRSASKRETKPSQAKVADHATKLQTVKVMPQLATKNIAVAAEDEIMTKWDEVVELAKLEAASIYTALRLAVPDYNEGILTLKFQFPLHQKKLMVAKNKDLVARLVEKITGQKIALEFIVDKASFSAKPESSTANSVLLEDKGISSISDIFGSAELLES